MAETDKSWWAKAILVGAVIAAVLLPIGALGSKFGIWGFQAGFLALAAGTVLAALGFVVGLVAIFVSRKRGFVEDASSLLVGVSVSGLIIAVMGVQIYAASSVPPIHNISTDVVEPPSFVAVVPLRGENANPLDYDAEKIAPMQQEAYPWVRPLELNASVADTVIAVEAALGDMGLEIVAVEPAEGRVEATATTFWFGFKDDVVVRVREVPSGSVVDVRSVSRVGLSDLGANARRIGELIDRLSP